MKTILEYMNDRVSEEKFSEFGNFVYEIRSGYSTNHGKMVDINETNAKAMIDKHTEFGYVVISPCKGIEWFVKGGMIPENEVGTQRGRDEMNRLNRDRIKKMISEIKKSGHSYTPVYGGFIENKGTDDEETVFERSFVIYSKDRRGNRVDFDGLYNLGLKMCKDYEQDSFLVQYPDGGPMQYVRGDGSVEKEFNVGASSFNDISKEYFTDLHKYHNPRQNSKLTRVTFESVLEGVYVNPGPWSYSEGHIRNISGERFVTDDGFV